MTHRTHRFVALVLLAGLAVVALAGTAGAQSFQKAQQGIDARLEASLSDLAKAREKIAREKIPLSKAVSDLEDEVLELRRERARLLKVRDSRSIDLSSLRAQVESMEDQQEFVKSRLNEFVRDFEARLDISEVPRYEERTDAAKLAEKNANLDAEGKRATQVAVVKAALERLDAQLGGQIFDGQALSPEGLLTQGKFVALGPTVFYASDDGEVAGLVEHQLNAAHPVIVPLPDDVGDDVLALAANEAAALPFDATLGKALKKEKASKTLVEYVNQGGAVGYVIVALGLAALLLTAFKCVEILGFAVAEPARSTASSRSSRRATSSRRRGRRAASRASPERCW